MGKYARFSLTPPNLVTGFYDTDIFNYPNLPPDNELLQLTDEQWAVRTANDWIVTNGGLLAYTHPVPLDRQADLELAARLAAGLALTSTGAPELNGTYALDAVSTAQVFQIGMFADRFAFFPSGAVTLQYPDITGMPHEFTVTEFVAFLQVVAPLVSNLSMQAGIMKAGGPPNWPVQTATIP